MRHLIRIEEPVPDVVVVGGLAGPITPLGEVSYTWMTFAQVWAVREDLSGREFFSAQQTNSEVTTRFVIRYREGLRPDMRIISDGLTYDIQSIADPDGRKRELHIMAVKNAQE